MNSTKQPSIVEAAQSQTIIQVAKMYAALNLSVIPLDGKRPALNTWKQHQTSRATIAQIDGWHKQDILKNIGIVCGEVSQNLVVLDLDGAAGYPAFVATFPHLAATYTVATGGGVGRHVYFRVEQMPPSIKAMNTPIGHLEICGDGRQVVAPPSVHPTTNKPYVVELAEDILHLESLSELVDWIESFKAPVPQIWRLPAPKLFPTGSATVNPRLINAIADTFIAQGFQQRGEWLHGRCIHPERHKNGDRNPSFGFNTHTGYGHCHLCGTMLTKDIAERLNINPDHYGGLVERSEPPQIRRKIDLSAVPDSQLPKVEQASYKLPSWLEQYMKWAGTTGNQTPMLFHQAAGLWLLSIAVGRRLYGEAPWGVKIYPNLYLMLIAGTTFYRKSTAYKLAEQVARASISHMLMPTPGSPERFQEALAGKLPSNFDRLTQEQQARFRKSQPFAAQRGLLKDEVAGLFGAINKRDYMVGMKDLLMELYDCPDYFDKDTQSGLNIVENAALSILGVTTPAGLGSAVSQADWANGLLIRFALLTPEPDYAERPAAKSYQPAPKTIIETLTALHERFPVPKNDDESPNNALKLQVNCWLACQAYGDHLRRLCDPSRDTDIDDRLKGVYGRMHVQAFKLASLFSALDWLDTDAPVPVVEMGHWQAAQSIAEDWRVSAHRLLEQLDHSGEAMQEKRHQDRMLAVIRETGGTGYALRDLYRKLHLPAKIGRQTAQELVKAGLVVEIRINGAEGYIGAEYLPPA